MIAPMIEHTISFLIFVGFFGFIVLGILNIIFFYIDAGAFSKLPTHKLEDPIDAFIQIGNNWRILLATVGKLMKKDEIYFDGKKNQVSL